MSNESNKYVFMRVKKNTRSLIKVEAAKKGFKSMDDYLNDRLFNDMKPINKEIKKKQNTKRGGFSIGF